MSTVDRQIQQVIKLVEMASDQLRTLKAESEPNVAAVNGTLAPYWGEPIATLRQAHDQLYKLLRDVMDRREAGLKSRWGHYSDAELRYAAASRCECGAGLAYHKEVGVSGQWECSDILTGRALPASHPDSKTHTPPLPFAFYEVKSEDQPSANGRTTRP